MTPVEESGSFLMTKKVEFSILNICTALFIWVVWLAIGVFTGEIMLM